MLKIAQKSIPPPHPIMSQVTHFPGFTIAASFANREWDLLTPGDASSTKLCIKGVSSMHRFSDHEYVIQPMEVAPGDKFAPDGPPLYVAHICIWGFLAEMLLAGSCLLLLTGAVLRAVVAAI